MWDLIIRNAKVVDGSGKDAFEADIAVDQGRIVCIAPDITGVGKRTLDAEGLVVCPGFIDIHTHSDFTLSDYPRAESRVHQGVTTEVVGNCGSTLGPVIKERFNEFACFVDSHGGIFKLPVGENEWKWSSLADYYRDLVINGVAVNIAPLVGHGAIRCAVLGFEDRAPNPTEMEEMQRLLRVEMEQGLFGMSAGLIYLPGTFAQTAELTTLARLVKQAGGLFTLHIRSECHGIMEAIQEALTIAEESGVSMEISHLKCELPANWGKSVQILSILDQVRERGLKVDFDQYPYSAFCCGLLEIFPPEAKEKGLEPLIKLLQDPVLRKKLEWKMTQPPFEWENPMEGLGWDKILLTGFSRKKNQSFDGKSVAYIAQALNLRPIEAVFSVFEDERGALAMIVFSMCEDDLERIMRHPATMIASDGISIAPHGTSPMGHPRSYGTFPRVLGHYVRQKGTLSLETAVSKMSGMPARKLGLRDRGLVRNGYAADLVVLEPDQITDIATFDAPHQYPVGIHYVMVNGQMVIEHGEHSGLLPGKMLKRRA